MKILTKLEINSLGKEIEEYKVKHKVLISRFVQQRRQNYQATQTKREKICREPHDKMRSSSNIM